jgi:hypothetical protein
VNQSRRAAVMTVAWIWVGVPFAYGVFALINRVIPLFTS